jgi:hypothetical protein
VVDGRAITTQPPIWPGASKRHVKDSTNRPVHGAKTIRHPRALARQLTSVIFDVPVAVTPGSVNPRTFAVDIAEGTVIQVLNAAAKASGLFWWTQTEKTASGSEALMVSLAGFDDRGGPLVTWPPQADAAPP